MAYSFNINNTKGDIMDYHKIYKNLIFKRKIIEPLEKTKEFYTELHSYITEIYI